MGTILRQRQILNGNTAFRRLIASCLLSSFGVAGTGLALPLTALSELKASALQIGILSAILYVAWLLFALPVGTRADRVRCQPLLFGAEAGRAATLGLAAIAMASGHLSIIIVYIVAGACGTLAVVYEVGQVAYMNRIVHSEWLVTANAGMWTARGVGTTTGLILSGLLADAAGPETVFLVCLAAFLGSAALTISIRSFEIIGPINGEATKSTKATRLPGASRLALRTFFSDATLRCLGFAKALDAVCYAGFSALILIFLADDVGISAALIGVLMALGGLGGILGPIFTPRMVAAIGPLRLIWLPAMIAAPVGLLIPLAATAYGTAMYLTAAIIHSFGFAAFGVGTNAIVQKDSRNESQGSNAAILRLCGRVFLPLGAASGGLLGDAIGSRGALTVVFGLWIGVPLTAWLSPRREVRMATQGVK